MEKQKVRTCGYQCKHFTADFNRKGNCNYSEINPELEVEVDNACRYGFLNTESPVSITQIPVIIPEYPHTLHELVDRQLLVID